MSQTTTLTSPSVNLRRRDGAAAGSTTVVVQPPQLSPKQPAPTPLILPPFQPPTVPSPKQQPSPPPSGPEELSEEELEAIIQERLRREQQRRLQLSPSIPMPPITVMPNSFSLVQFDSTETPGKPFRLAMETHGDAVGLLRRLSVYPSYLNYLSQKFFSAFSAYSDWALVQEKLLGTKSKDEFLGYGSHRIPNHDQLGWFPMFEDAQGRQYFEHAITNNTQPRKWLSDQKPPGHDQETTVSFVVRIPRHKTRKTNANFHGSRQDDMDFPQPGETLTLRLCGLPFFPFYPAMTFAGPDVRSIREEGTGQLLDTRYAQMVRLESATSIYQKRIQVKVASTDNHIDAVCSVNLEIINDQFRNVYVPAQVLREEWSINITDLFVALASHRTDAKRMVGFCDFIHNYWLHTMAKWSRTKDAADFQVVQK